MIRGMTALWTALAVIIGVGLFLLKYEVSDLDAKLAAVNQEIYDNKEAIHVLKAEWSYLNDPDRLRDLNDRHLGLQPILPVRIASIDALPVGGAAPAAGEQPRTVAETAPSPKATPAAAAKRPAHLPSPAGPTRHAATQPAALPPVPAAAPVRTAATRPSPKPAPSPPAPAAMRAVMPAPLPAETRSNVIVVKSPALLEAELAGRRTRQ